MKQLIEPFKPALLPNQISFDRPYQALVKRSEPMLRGVQALNLDMAPRRQRGAEPCADIIELLRAPLLRSQHAADEPVLEPFEFLPIARQSCLRRLVGEAMDETREGETPAIKRLARSIVKGSSGAIDSLPRQGNDRIALRQRAHEAPQIGLPPIEKPDRTELWHRLTATPHRHEHFAGSGIANGGVCDISSE